MIKKSLAAFVFILCLGLLLAGCPKTKVAVDRDQSSVQSSEEAARRDREREAREAKERE